MTELESLKKHYRWTALDEVNMSKLSPFATKKAEDFANKFYEFIFTFEDITKYLNNESIIVEHKEKVTEWFLRLFTGSYDEDYMRMLFKIGLTHVRIGLEPHYVNSAVSFVREYLNECIADTFHDRVTRDSVRASMSKLLDMNLDMISSSYRQEELRQYLATSKIQKSIITFVTRFSFVLDMALILILSFIAVIAVAFVVGETANIFLEPYGASKAVVKILGDLLILWSVSELIQEGIKHTKGSKFAVKSFVAVGLAACIREILIASLGHQTDTILVLTATTLSLGAVYFLLSKSQTNS